MDNIDEMFEESEREWEILSSESELEDENDEETTNVAVDLDDEWKEFTKLSDQLHWKCHYVNNASEPWFAAHPDGLTSCQCYCLLLLFM